MTFEWRVYAIRMKLHTNYIRFTYRAFLLVNVLLCFMWILYRFHANSCHAMWFHVCPVYCMWSLVEVMLAPCGSVFRRCPTMWLGSSVSSLSLGIQSVFPMNCLAGSWQVASRTYNCTNRPVRLHEHLQWNAQPVECHAVRLPSLSRFDRLHLLTRSFLTHTQHRAISLRCWFLGENGHRREEIVFPHQRAVAH